MTTKEAKFQRRLEERKAKRGATKSDALAEQGLKYVTFCLPIQLFDIWAGAVVETGKTPNDKIKELIIWDMKGGING